MKKEQKMIKIAIERKKKEQLKCDKCGSKEFIGYNWETEWWEEAIYLYCIQCNEELVICTE